MFNKVVIGNAELYHGDCREIELKADVVITDPPYGFGAYSTDDANGVVEFLQYWKRKAVFGYPEILCEWCAKWGKPDEWVTWWPTNKPCGRTFGLSRESEAIVIFGQLFEMPKRPRILDACRRKIYESRKSDLRFCKDGDVWRDPSPGCGFNSHLRQHPNEKPKSLMIKLVRLCSVDGETILDPYMGSGTTGIACIELGLRFIGCEIEKKYFDIACKRIEEAQRQYAFRFSAAGI